MLPELLETAVRLVSFHVGIYFAVIPNCVNPTVDFQVFYRSCSGLTTMLSCSTLCSDSGVIDVKEN
jgi:hypothetical protein